MSSSFEAFDENTNFNQAHLVVKLLKQRKLKLVKSPGSINYFVHLRLVSIKSNTLLNKKYYSSFTSLVEIYLIAVKYFKLS